MITAIAKKKHCFFAVESISQLGTLSLQNLM